MTILVFLFVQKQSFFLPSSSLSLFSLFLSSIASNCFASQTLYFLLQLIKVSEMSKDPVLSSSLIIPCLVLKYLFFISLGCLLPLPISLEARNETENWQWLSNKGASGAGVTVYLLSLPHHSPSLLSPLPLSLSLKKGIRREGEVNFFYR